MGQIELSNLGIISINHLYSYSFVQVDRIG